MSDQEERELERRVEADPTDEEAKRKLNQLRERNGKNADLRAQVAALEALIKKDKMLSGHIAPNPFRRQSGAIMARRGSGAIGARGRGA